jgi:hypothetical protein
LGDFSRIGRFFSLGSFFKYKRSPKFGASFFDSKRYVQFLTKYGLGNILGDFLTNSSGRPVQDLPFKPEPLQSRNLNNFLRAKMVAVGETRTQSYDRELQRQRCKFLQRYG